MELIKKEFGQNLLINNNPANFFITKIFQKKGVLINNILRYPNENIFIENPIAKKKILFEYLTQIQINFNKSALTNENIVLIPKNNKIKKPNKGIIITEIPKN